MRSLSTPFPFVRIAVAGVLAVALCSACDRAHDGRIPSARRCETPKVLPGSAALPSGLAAAVATADVPAEALIRKRRVCNRLALEPGAFARQHALDAIDWRKWSPQALAEATTLGRPLFVLSGFSACEACIELSRGALSRRRLARALNRHFVPVLVDREERPDVDAYLMQAVQVLTGGAGWPSVVFLQPDGRPFEAQSWGAAGVAPRKLEKMVEEIARRITLGGGTIEERAELTAEKMERRATVDTSGPLPDAAAVAAALRGYLVEEFDAEAGSFGPVPLFPRAPVLEFLLRLNGDSADAGALDMVTISLDRLRLSPLADRAGGGFHRYAKRAAWQEPAPEKMLADNAAIASAYLDAAAVGGRAEFRETARTTIEFMLRDLGLPDGVFAASLDATRGNGRAFARDDRILADANALAVSALVRASKVLGEARYLEAAAAAGRFLDSRLRDGGRVIHCAYVGGARCADGYLPDQALVALAFLDLDAAGAPGGGRWLDAARTIADAMPASFGHEGTGGFFLSAVDAQPLPLRFKPALDGAVACGNSAAAWLFVRLAARTPDARYSAEARRTFEAFSRTLTLRPLALPSMVGALMRSSAPPQLEPAPAVQP